jgi:murein DD-endopeptidase MepM/ murein hydrolase activator NlpD
MAAAMLLSFAAACDQSRPPFSQAPRSSRLPATPTTSPENLENTAPPPGRIRRPIVIKRVKKVIGGQGPFVICPVQAEGYFSNNFGPRSGGHFHEGVDMYADFGSPVVAPFDGKAVAARNDRGGLTVKVFGRDGYVYNAQLIAYGKLGDVKAGTVIGYVGNTGAARGGPPHNHFEWHPRNGRPVDPFPYLQEVCR